MQARPGCCLGACSTAAVPVLTMCNGWSYRVLQVGHPACAPGCVTQNLEGCRTYQCGPTHMGAACELMQHPERPGIADCCDPEISWSCIWHEWADTADAAGAVRCLCPGEEHLSGEAAVESSPRLLRCMMEQGTLEWEGSN